MKKNFNRVSLFAARWWNPLFWLLVLIIPPLGIICGIACGVFTGFLLGYERSLDITCRKLRALISTLP